MTLRGRKKVATTLKKIVKAELTGNATWNRVRLLDGLRRLARQAQLMELQPEDVLTDVGRDAFTVIARAIAKDSMPFSPLRAEWQLILVLAEPEFSIEEQELFAS